MVTCTCTVADYRTGRPYPHPPEAKAGISVSEDTDRPGAELPEQACTLGLESIIAKSQTRAIAPGALANG